MSTSAATDRAHCADYADYADCQQVCTIIDIEPCRAEADCAPEFQVIAGGQAPRPLHAVALTPAPAPTLRARAATALRQAWRDMQGVPLDLTKDEGATCAVIGSLMAAISFAVALL